MARSRNQVKILCSVMNSQYCPGAHLHHPARTQANRVWALFLMRTTPSPVPSTASKGLSGPSSCPWTCMAHCLSASNSGAGREEAAAPPTLVHASALREIYLCIRLKILPLGVLTPTRKSRSLWTSSLCCNFIPWLTKPEKIHLVYTQTHTDSGLPQVGGQ